MKSHRNATGVRQLGIALRRPRPRPEGPGGDARTGFWHHCSVFKEPRPDARPTEGRSPPPGDRRADTHSACREVWCGTERPCQVLQPRGEPSGERTHQPMGRIALCQTVLGPRAFPMGPIFFLSGLGCGAIRAGPAAVDGRPTQPA